jgi:hypothetical protein
MRELPQVLVTLRKERAARPFQAWIWVFDTFTTLFQLQKLYIVINSDVLTAVVMKQL